MDVTLRWDANTESNRAGYRIYYDIDSGPPYEGSGAAEGDSPIDVTIAAVETGDLAQFQLTNLDDDQIYYFAITAYDTIGNESGYSNEVSTADDVDLGDAASGSSSSGCFLSTIKF